MLPAKGALSPARFAVAALHKLMCQGNDTIKTLKKAPSSLHAGNLSKRRRAKGVLPIAPQPSEVFCVWGALGNCGSWVSIRLIPGKRDHPAALVGKVPVPLLGTYKVSDFRKTQISGKFLSYLGSVRANELQFQQPLGPGLTLGKQLCYKYLPDEVNHQYP